MNTTDEWWDIDGVSLHQQGWNVATVGGSRYDLPPRRGENIKLAYRPGMTHRPKLADSRTITLVMWLTGGYRPNSSTFTPDQRLAWNDSWDFLRRLVWKVDGAQVTLTRRWQLTVDGTPTIVRAEALAEIGDTMTPTMTGRTRADFTMTLLMANPYFYGVDASDSDSPWTTVPLIRNVASSVVNDGHDNAAFGYLEVDFIGPLTKPKLTNATPNPNVWVRYDDTIPAGQTIRLRVPQFQAQLLGGPSVAGKIVHSGSRHWMRLNPKANLLTLTCDAGTGSAVMRFRPPYV